MRYPTVDRLVEAYSLDISQGGMFLETQRFLPLNAVIRLDFVLPEMGGDLTVIARVAYIRSPSEAASCGKPAGMGVQFLDMSGENARRIEQFITERTAVPATERSGPIKLQRSLDVLVVDDDEAYRKRAAAPFLAREDKVRTAVDGLEGLAACLKQPPDVVLLDVQMPRMDGWALLRMIRARPSLASTPVIFLTTLFGEDDRLLGYQLGVDDYLPKPYAADELVLRVDRIVARADRVGRSTLEKKTLRGDLEQVGLASVLSFLEMERKTGVLLVVSARTARIYLRDGRPLAIDVRDSTEATPMGLVFEVLGWMTGQFEFAALDVNCPDVLQSSATSILLEHARLMDEAKR